MDYRSTVFLPKTTFSMKANLSRREPEILKFWEENKLYEKLKNKNDQKKSFHLHSGPPYANGNIHMGHALNVILKDIFTKAHRKIGYYAPLVPGWDCHGLPIEWKIEEKYRKKKKNKDDVDPTEFRSECREFAKKWMNVQREEFKRLGVLADWENPYCTMDFETEGKIVKELGKFLMNGSLYRGTRPVMWSVIEKTALADAEVEYKNHISDSIYVSFPVKKASIDKLNDVSVVIWTTTPWTIPANRAISYHKDLNYVVISHDGNKYLIAKELIDNFAKSLEMDVTPRIIYTISGEDLKGSICSHPFHEDGYDFDVPLIHGDHVTTDAGTGLVHTAPGHGVEDFHVGKEYGLECPKTVDEGGLYESHVPVFAGEHIFKVNPKIIELIKSRGRLLHSSKFEHSYPHSWRSKAPLIYRTTSQWFINVDHNGLREKAIEAIKNTGWYPKTGLNRIMSMVKDRPDWCISRQRAWGTPITLFVHKTTGELLRDENVFSRIVDIISKEGADAWFNSPSSRFLGSEYNSDDYEQVKDILDVWFDSGTTHSFVLDEPEGKGPPADLYLEGSDQHRGWFQSSLLHSCGTRGRAPYKNVCTHGYVLDGNGHKMSKSMGNVISPSDILKDTGADILRLWVANVDYNDDIRISMDMIKHQQDIYRRFRNTIRYIIGAISQHDCSEEITYDDLPSLEKWVLHNVNEINEEFKKATETFSFMDFYHKLHNFCSIDLSAYYFDIRKDTIYCDKKSNKTRRSSLYVFNILFDHLIHWLSPVLSFTAEEAYWEKNGLTEDDGISIHSMELKSNSSIWKNDEINNKWKLVREIRSVVTGALEVERAAKTIGSSLQAKVSIYIDKDLNEVVKDVDWAELSITSNANIIIGKSTASAFKIDSISGVGVVVSNADGEKCNRCWKVLREVSDSSREDKICIRCENVVKDV